MRTNLSSSVKKHRINCEGEMADTDEKTALPWAPLEALEEQWAKNAEKKFKKSKKSDHQPKEKPPSHLLSQSVGSHHIVSNNDDADRLWVFRPHRVV